MRPRPTVAVVKIIGRLVPDTKHECKLGYPDMRVYKPGDVIECECGKRYVCEFKIHPDEDYGYQTWRELRRGENVAPLA